MKVEFTVDECQQMFEAVMDEILELDIDRGDRATLRRWRSDEMAPGDALMQALAGKINHEIQLSHDRSEVSPIKKPDWAR